MVISDAQPLPGVHYFEHRLTRPDKGWAVGRFDEFARYLVTPKGVFCVTAGHCKNARSVRFRSMSQLQKHGWYEEKPIPPDLGEHLRAS